MNDRLVLVIAIDGLRASALGTYGNTTFPTPLLDALASRSAVVEWQLATSPRLDDFYTAAIEPVIDANITRWLITDDLRLADSRRGQFDHCVALEVTGGQVAPDIEATRAARFFAQVYENLSKQQQELRSGCPTLVWIHFSGLCGLWDAPTVMRDQLLDEDDPPAMDVVFPPESVAVTDPDELLGFRVAYAAQVMAIGQCVAGLSQGFDQLFANSDRLTIITGSRGFALGEHGYVGFAVNDLYSEQLHLPLLMSASSSEGTLPRLDGFVRPTDIGTTIAGYLLDESGRARIDAFSLLPRTVGKPGLLRDVASACDNQGGHMIRTSAWKMIHGERIELYVKPDDRWEANDVSTRLPDVVELLVEHLKALQAGHLLPLPEVLSSPWR